MRLDRVSNTGPLALELDVLLTALHGSAGPPGGRYLFINKMSSTAPSFSLSSSHLPDMTDILLKRT